MLSSLLDSIKKQFSSKAYWLGCMLPLILFLAANALVASWHWQWIGTAIPRAQGWDEKVFAYSALLGLLLAVAYILSTMSGTLLNMLEGKAGPFWWFSRLLCPAQMKALARLDRDYKKARKNRDLIAESLGKRWLETLKQGEEVGLTAPPLSEKEAAQFKKSVAGKAVARIRERQSHNLNIEPHELHAAVAELTGELLKHRTGSHGILVEAVRTLRAAIQYSMDRYEYDVRRLLKRRQTNFPGQRPTAEDLPEGPVSIDILAPTTMGNIGRTIATYTIIRYGLDLDIFWTRLQSSLQQSSKEYYGVLEDSKVQVDSMVMLFWLSALFTLFWTGALVFLKDSTLIEFVTVSITGTLAVLMFYSLACHAYRVFTDVMRASVDMYRFDMLKSLHLPLPIGTDEEKDLWYRLGGATGFLDPEPFVFKHPTS